MQTGDQVGGVQAFRHVATTQMRINYPINNLSVESVDPALASDFEIDRWGHSTQPRYSLSVFPYETVPRTHPSRPHLLRDVLIHQFRRLEEGGCKYAA